MAVTGAHTGMSEVWSGALTLRNLLWGARIWHNPARKGNLPMIRQEQYEIWVQSGDSKWDMLGCFEDLTLAAIMARNHPARTRLICITFEHGKVISQELLTEMGFEPERLLA